MRKRVKEKEERAASQKRVTGLAAAAKAFGAFRPATEVLKRVRAVPTRFVQFDHATRVGGFPIERFSLLHGPSNEGKAQPTSESVLTPSGWVPIGELCVGDKVIGSSGEATRVTGVFPQGRKKIVRVVLDDGTSTRCCKEHLWFTTTIVELNRGRYVRLPRPGRSRVTTGKEGKGSVKKTEDIARTIDDGHYLPAHGVVQFDLGLPDPLPLDPYTLGALLGDGSLTVNSPFLTSSDYEIMHSVAGGVRAVGDWVTWVEGKTCLGLRINGGRTREILKKLGIWGHKSDTKTVPDTYLFASPEKRLDLLRGLMDTDGTLNSSTTNAQFCTTSVHLRDAVLHLVRSLGGSATFWLKETPTLPAWIVGICFQDGTCPFRLRRKAEKWTRMRKRVVRRRIVRVEDCGESQCVCIRVAAKDSLYLTEDFIPTHNSLWALGLVASFLQREHFALYVDAERTTPIDWVQNLLGPLHSHPGFYAIRPDNYEDTIGKVRSFLNLVAQVRADGTVPPDTSAIVVVDSLKKLVPKDLMAEILEEVKKPAEITAGRDRKGQIQAKMNAAWMDELVPLLEHAQAGFLAIAREMIDPDNTDVWAKKAGTNYKVGGGTAIYYDASLVVRVERDGWVAKKSAEKGVRDITYGERHKVTVRKTKIGGKEGRDTVCYFHSSNGVLIPEGFDRARDVLELGVKFGVIEQSGAWFSFEGEKLGAGLHAVVKALTEHPELLATIESVVRGQFRKVEPEDFDPEPGEVT